MQGLGQAGVRDRCPSVTLRHYLPKESTLGSLLLTEEFYVFNCVFMINGVYISFYFVSWLTLVQSRQWCCVVVAQYRRDRGLCVSCPGSYSYVAPGCLCVELKSCNFQDFS